MPLSTADSFTGFGVPAQLANLLGANASLLNCVGTAQSGAAVVLSRNTELNTSGGATAAVFPSDAGVMQPYFIVNPDATTGLVFVPSGHTVNGSLNGSVSIAQNKAAIIWQYKPKFWASVLTA